MKYIEWIMLTIQVVVVAIICFAVFGCANTADVKTTRLENEGRKHSENTNKPAPGYGGDIGMPQEWLDQWPSTRKIEEQIENSVIGVHQ